MSQRMVSFCLVIVLAMISICGNSQKKKPVQEPGITITYTGNMGIHISGSLGSVLIDGLHEYYGPEYLHPPDSEIRRILEQQGSFSNLNLALFTHYHRDHYSAKLSKFFLQSSVRNLVAGPPQVTDSLPTMQTLNAWNKNAILFTDSIAGLHIYSFNIPHTWQQRHSKVQNVAYLVKSNKSNILHVGDADTDAAAFSRLNLGRIDVMIVPLWFLMGKEGIYIIKEIVKPERVIATHISPNEKLSMDKYKLPGIETSFFAVMNQAVHLPN